MIARLVVCAQHPSRFLRWHRSLPPRETCDIADAAYGTDDRKLLLRSTRSGVSDTPGRVYTVNYIAIDASGNSGQQSATVCVRATEEP